MRNLLTVERMCNNFSFFRGRISRSVDNYGDGEGKDSGGEKRNGKFASDPILAQGQLQIETGGFDKNKNF